MAQPNLFEELQEALDEFNEFLESNRGTIKPAVAPLDELTDGRVTELINELKGLLGTLREEIDKFDLGQIGDAITEVTGFTQNVRTLLETSKALLPDEADTIDDILDVADIVTSLPSVEQLKDELKQLIDDIIGHLDFLIT